MRQKWRSLRRLDWRDRWLLARSIVALPTLAWQLRRKGLQHVQQRLGRQLPPPSADGRQLQTAQRAAWVIDVAARRGLWRANCLQRSVALWHALGKRGIATDLRIGVRKDPGAAAPSFHAWVELDGAVLNDRDDVGEEFAAFDRAIAPRGAAFD